VLIVTADHGFTALAPTSDRPYPVITFGRDLLRAQVNGMHLVADGGVEHVYADAIAAEATTLGADVEPLLARIATLARETPGVSEVLARLPVHDVTGLASAHPDWHLDHQRTGELLLVAAPGYEFVDPFDPVDAGLLGNHGGPAERSVPLVVAGGYTGLRHAPPGTPGPALVDVAPTIAALLGLRLPRRLDGAPLAAELAGHPLLAVLPETQSPH
jgi:arylsulfatase A-like enzyme